MTVAYDIAASRTDEDEWFGRVGTTPPTVMRGTRKFIACVFMAGYAATSTLSTVTPADAIALNAITAQPSTLAAIPVQPAPPLDQRAVPGILQRLRRLSGLSREIAEQLESRGALSTTGSPVPVWRPCTMPGYLSWAGW